MALTLSTGAEHRALEAAMYKSGELQHWTDEDSEWWNCHHSNPRDQIQIKVVVHQVMTHRVVRRTDRPRRKTVSAGKKTQGNSDDGEPPRSHQPIHLLDQADLADILSISKKTLQNIHSVTPHLLPKAISIPGARGPRWTAQAVQSWLDARPAYSTAPKAAQRKVGRPRIALAVAAGKGGAS